MAVYYNQYMKKLIFVVFLLLFSNALFAEQVDERVSEIESVWMEVDETEKDEARTYHFLQLVKDITAVVLDFPAHAEPLILKSAILLTMAQDASNFSALGLVNQAKDLLQKAVGINPKASEGSALVTLGVLYYKVPAWPIAFGDNDKAEEYLLAALKINPVGIDSNYYYAEFLLEQGEKDKAVAYLNKAIAVKIEKNDPELRIKLKEQAKARITLEKMS